MPLVVPTFASTVDAMNNRMKARQEGKVPQGYLSEYDWNQYGRKLEAENKQIAAEQEAERQANPQPSGPMATGNQIGRRFLGPSTPAGQVPAGIKAANPEAYFDPRLGSTVIGASGRNRNARGGPTWSGNAMKNGSVMQNTNMASFGMAGPNQSRGTIGGRATPPAPDMFGRQFGQPEAPDAGFDPGPSPMGTTTDGDKIGRLRMNAPKPYKPGLMGLAEGGEVEGPGGPKDDMVPAMLSDGEFVMPAEAVKFFGLKHLHGMTQKAKEGMMEMPSGSADIPVRSGAPEADRDVRAPSMMMHFAAGGFVNPYADDPALYAMRQQEARDASLAMSGIADMGGGNMTLNNRYGTGFAVPTTQGIPDMPGRFNNGGNTVTATPGRGLSMVPDIVPSGPWAAPTLPWEAQPQRENIAFMQRQMIPGAEGRRADDLATDTRQMALQPKGRRIITVPDANPFPYGDHGGTERTGFLSPSEKDAQDAAARNTPIQPFLDAGMKKSDIRKMMRTPQGVASMMEMQAARNKAPSNQAMPVIMPDGSPSKTHYMVNGMALPFGQDAQRRTDPHLVDVLTRSISDPGMSPSEREKARKALSDHLGVDVPMPSAKAPASGKFQRGTIDEAATDANGVTSTRKVPVVFNEDGTYTRMREAGTSEPSASTKPGSRFLQKVK